MLPAVAVPLLFAAAAVGLGHLTLPRTVILIDRAGFVRMNYRGEMIPASVGTFVALIYATTLVAWLAASPSNLLHTLLFVTVAMALVGFIDDVLGDKSVQGLRGHGRLLLRGDLSTGGVKAVFGAVVAFGASSGITDGWLNVAVGTVIIALTTNTVNLLDLRPGRAVKGAITLMGLLYVSSPAAAVWGYMLPLLGVLVVYAPYDLRARAMLGDGGANAVGGVLGVAAVAALSPAGRAVMALLLIGLHLFAEGGSISRVIERVPALKSLDEWGRD